MSVTTRTTILCNAMLCQHQVVLCLYSRGFIRFYILHMCEMSSLYVLQVCSLSTFECQGRLWMQLNVKVFKLQQPGLALGSCQMTCLLISGWLSFPNMSDPSVSPYLVFHDISIYFIWTSASRWWWWWWKSCGPAWDYGCERCWRPSITKMKHCSFTWFFFHLSSAWAENCAHQSPKK